MIHFGKMKGKLQKFADMSANPLVVEYPWKRLQEEPCVLRGNWHNDFFHNDHPITLELGCGRGEYAIGLGKTYPDRNFIGVDIKGARMWHGAMTAMKESMKNVGFLRTNIECIDKIFAENEVDEIWLTFSDPQMKKATKRLTSTYFLERYRHFLKDGGLIHLKTDSKFLYTYTKIMAEHNHLEIMACTEDLYNESTFTPHLSSLRSIRTYYEQMWLDKGIAIKYLGFRLPHDSILEESGVEIPMDNYRSYDHEFVKELKTAK